MDPDPTTAALMKPRLTRLGRPKKRRSVRQVIQVNQVSLRGVFCILTGFCILFALWPQKIAPTIGRYQQVARSRQEAIAGLQRKRPPASEYFNEQLLVTDHGAVLRGDCLVGGVWQRYWIRENGGVTILPTTKAARLSLRYRSLVRLLLAVVLLAAAVGLYFLIRSVRHWLRHSRLHRRSAAVAWRHSR